MRYTTLPWLVYSISRCWYLLMFPLSTLEKKMAIHSSILAWKIPWTVAYQAPLSMGLQRVGHEWAAEYSIPHFYINSIELRRFTGCQRCLRRAENPCMKLSAWKTYQPLLRKQFPSWPMQPSERNLLSQDHFKSFHKLSLHVLWLIPDTVTHSQYRSP